MTTVCVFGGSGFLGGRLVRRLAAEGATLRIAVRSPDRAHGVLRAADLAAAAGVARLVLVSGIGADPGSRSPYIRARGRGELVYRPPARRPRERRPDL